jgi:hypothetical protein
MSTTFNRTTNIHRRLDVIRLVACAAVGIGLLSVPVFNSELAHADDLSNDLTLCAADRPCIDQLNQNGTTVTVGWYGDQKYDHYNFRWNGPGHPESQTQIDGGARGSASIPVDLATPGYTVKVQGCNVDLFGHSTCSPWDEDSFTSHSGYGPAGCKQGFVWRAARPSDLVCVTPQTRDETAQENQAAAARRDPKGGAYGQDTCLQGFVWRGAFEGDHVCVTPQSRDQASADNAAAASRIAH